MAAFFFPNQSPTTIVSKLPTRTKDVGSRSGKRWLVGASVVALGVAIGLYFALRPSREEPAALIEPSTEAEPEAEALAVGGEEVVEDDGRSLWVSPTGGAPISLSYLPHGTQLVLHLRPAELLAHAEGEKVLAALGPWREEAVALVEREIGVPLSEVEALTVAVYPALDGELRTVWRLSLAKPSSDLPSLVGSGDRKNYFPAHGQVLVSCPAKDAAELKEQGDEPALFPRDMQRLLDLTDSARTATLVFSPRFLQTEGHKILSGGATQLEAIVADLAGDTATAVALSADWGEDFFLELQSTVTLDQQPHRFGATVQQWLPRAAEAMETAIRADPGHPYGREVIKRFPAMLRYLSEYTRGEEVNGVSVLRCYLPVVAGHNLLMAAELFLDQPQANDPSSLTASATPQTIDEKLLQVTSLSFPKETLERALQLLSEDVGLKIEIAGRDLQLEGITKNQSFGIDLRDRPAGEILLAVLRLANPDRTATGPADERQKLVFVLSEDASEGSGAIVVTTRSAALRRGDKLSQVFLPESD